MKQAVDRVDSEFEIVDIADFNLPILNEAYPVAYQNYQNNHTKAFCAEVAEFDGYIFVVAEYNHSITGALKNALDYLTVEFNNNAAGFVYYGSKGGARAVEHLRGFASELQLAHVRNQVMLSIFTDVENSTTLKPFKRDLETAQVELLDGGHFLLETHLHEVADLMLGFLGPKHQPGSLCLRMPVRAPKSMVTTSSLWR